MEKIYTYMTLTQLFRERDKVTQDAAMDATQKEQKLQMIKDEINKRESRTFSKCGGIK